MRKNVRASSRSFIQINLISTNPIWNLLLVINGAVASFAKFDKTAIELNKISSFNMLKQLKSKQLEAEI